MNPAELIHERDALRAEIARLENLTASGVHSCSIYCQRPMCVLRRERDNALADLARVAELVAALREVLESPDSTISGHLYYRMEKLLARAESATPTKQEVSRE